MNRHLIGLPGGRPAGALVPGRPHPSLYDREAESAPETVFIPLTALEWSLIHQALVERGTGNSLRPGGQAWLDLAARVRAGSRPTRDTDPTPPHGLRRVPS